MRISKPAFYAFGVTAAAALLAACSGGGSPSSGMAPATGVNSSSVGQVRSLKEHVTLTARISKPLHKRHIKSWVAKDAAAAPRLLFISDDGTNQVNMYTMPGMVLKGELTNFSEPQGMCSDAAGNIWVTNTGTASVIQLSRTGTVLNTLTDGIGFPVGCAVNKKTGDLAVTNIFDDTGSGASVLVYPNATGTPEEFSSTSLTEIFFPTYDASGNLFVDGFGPAGFALGEVPAGSTTLTNVSISGATLFFPGGMNWDGANSSLVIGDQECEGAGASCQYSATVSGGVATITGSTSLDDKSGLPAGDVDQAVIGPQGRYFAGGIISADSNASSVDRWMFPAGGVPTNFNDTTVVEPIGAAISNK
jgi:hypothetical protein